MQVTEFKVDSVGTLSMLGHREPETRAEFYEEFDGVWSKSPQTLSDAMNECPPLNRVVQRLYSDIRKEISLDVHEARMAGTGHEKRISALQARLCKMPEGPEYGVEDWLLALTTSEFEQWISPRVQKWFESPPEWAYEIEYLPQNSTARGAAMAFFQSLNVSQLRLLGVKVLEGDCPGSSYYAAELRGTIAEANRAAEEAGIAVRFVAATG